MVKRRIRTSGKKKDKSKSNALKFLVMIILIGVILYVLIGRNNQVSLVQGFRYDSNASLLVENGKIVVVYVGAEWHSDTIVVREDGIEQITNYPKDLDSLIIRE